MIEFFPENVGIDFFILKMQISTTEHPVKRLLQRVDAAHDR